MGRDRFPEFLIKASIREISENQLEPANSDQSRPGTLTKNGTEEIEMKTFNKDFPPFWIQVKQVSKLISKLETDVEQIKSLQSSMLTLPIPDERTKSELDDLMATIKANCQLVRAELKEIKNSNNEFLEPASGRIRTTQHSTLAHNFIEVLNEYQTLHVEYRDDCKVRLKRQFEIVDIKLSEAEVDDMIDKGDFAVFTQAQGLMIETEQAREILADVENRHKDFLKLEKSLVELHELFVEMAYLVKSGGDQIDSIAAHVKAAQDFVSDANDELKTVVGIKGKRRKRKIALVIIFVLVIVFLIYRAQMK